MDRLLNGDAIIRHWQMTHPNATTLNPEAFLALATLIDEQTALALATKRCTVCGCVEPPSPLPGPIEMPGWGRDTL